MARAHGIAILAAIGCGTALWLWLAAQQQQAPPPPPAPPTAAPRNTAPDEPVRTPLPPPLPIEPAPGTDAPVPPPAPVPVAPAATDTGLRVQLRVRDLQTKADIATFRWRFRGDGLEPADAALARKGEGQRGAADLVLPLEPGTLLVEADGYAPEQFQVAAPAGTREPLHVDAFLGPQPPLAGIVLHCTDDVGWPVRRLRIDLWQLAATAPEPPAGVDPEGQALWSRTGASADGRFQLPPLPAGRFALRAQPFDDHDEPAPLQPWRQVFAFAGHESLPFHVAFTPGILLALEAAPGAAPQDYTVHVRGHDGAIVPVRWRSRSDDAAVVALGRARLPPRATALLPLPPGGYELEVMRGEQPCPAARAVAGRVWTFTVGEPR